MVRHLQRRGSRAALTAAALLAMSCGARGPLEDETRLARDVSEPEPEAGAGAGGTGGSATGMPALPPCPGLPQGSTGPGWKGPVEVLASGQVGLYNLAIDDLHVYFTARGVALDDGELRRMPKSGGPVTVMAVGLHNPTDVLVDETHVTWLEASVNGGIRRMPKEPGAVVSTLTTVDAYRLEEDDAHVYFSALGSMEVSKVPKAGGPVATLASMQEGPQQVAVGSDHVYWASYPTGNVRRVAKSGGPVTSVSAKGGGLERGVAVDCHGVFWVAGTTLRWRAVEGGPEVVVADVPPGEAFLSLDATHVYLAREAPIRVPRVGGAVEAFPKGTGTLYGPTIRLDATHAYWVDAPKATVNRIAK